MDIHYKYIQILFTLTFVQLSQLSLLPIHNPITRCHDLTLHNEDLTFAICLQRASNKHHPYNLYTSPSFCSNNYPPDGHLVDLLLLSSSVIEQLFQSVTNLLNSKTSLIDFPEPNFFWISSKFTQNLTNEDIWCPDECQSKDQSMKFLILKSRCSTNETVQPCVTSKNTHWTRGPFICLTNQILTPFQPVLSLPTHVTPTYSRDTIIFYDSNSCLIARTATHQYTFCFRRQSCSQSQTSAFCTTKLDAHNICQQEKNGSNLLTIENNDEYQLINDIISHYSNETLLNSDGIITKKYITRAQWMWIDGIKGSDGVYKWNISDTNLSIITDNYWCNNIDNCTGGKGRDHVALNIVCQMSNKTHQICLASRRQSEPGPFICKRILTADDGPIANYHFLRDAPLTTTTTTVTPVYEKESTSIYYDEHHCLTVQTRTHLYTFCLRRQDCVLRKAYCTKWSQAKKDCQLLKNNSQLLTIDNKDEHQLITDIMTEYLHETRLNYNGSSYRYYRLADFLWIDGIRQADNETYLWKNEQEPIPKDLWCPEDDCNSIGRERAMLNLLCNKTDSLICLGTRTEWKPAPYVCKRIRPIDYCPILFDKIRTINSNEMLIVTVNRTIALIKCKYPEYNLNVRVQYECNLETNQWELIYENNNFICPYPNATSTTVMYETPEKKVHFFQMNCPQPELLSFKHQLPTETHYINSEKLPSYSSDYYDMKLTCYFNHSIQITYRCDLSTRRWIYVHGSSQNFQLCYPKCRNDEQINLLNKYFTPDEQVQIDVKRIRSKNSLRLRCYNANETRWKTISYKCGTLTISSYQWFKINSCFQKNVPTVPTVVLSMGVNQSLTECPPAVTPGSPCESHEGQYIFDANGCARKVCPKLSYLCNTIRCPPDRVCRVVPCKSCNQTDYLQAVCEYPTEPTLCELEKQLFLLNDSDSISRWEHQIMVLVRHSADEQRQRLLSPWPILTIN